MSTYHPLYVAGLPRPHALLPAPNLRSTPVFHIAVGDRTAAPMYFKPKLMSTGGQHHPAVALGLSLGNQPKQNIGEDYGVLR